MAIGSAVQRGSLIFVYDEGGRRLTSLLAVKGPKDGLQGYTSSTVSVRRSLLSYTYDERGRRLSSTLARR
jgi:YD repeat-containing protein